MSTPGKAPAPASLGSFSHRGGPETYALLETMLRQSTSASDLIFSPGRVPQIEVHGQLVAVQGSALPILTADDTRRLAAELIGDNKQAISALREQGFCDVSYALPGLARFRANIFIQRGSCAVVMRVIPTTVPDFSSIGLPEHLGEIASLRDGIVLVTGPRGSGKSSTLAALLDRINQQQTCHIVTIEDPIEFLHNHKKATVHQRELHSDTPSFGHALRAALRQAPRVILVSEIRERETMELALQASETGHLVLSSLNTPDAAKALERIGSFFASTDQSSVRRRLAKTLRYVISQRLLPRREGNGRVAAREIFRMNAAVLNLIECGEASGEVLLEKIKAGKADGMQHFDAEIARLLREGVVDFEVAMAHATDPNEVRLAVPDLASAAEAGR
jgi:twitching motility protein PilT